MRTEFGASGTLHAVEQCHIKGRLPFISLPWISVDILTLLTTLAEAAWISCCP